MLTDRSRTSSELARSSLGRLVARRRPRTLPTSSPLYPRRLRTLSLGRVHALLQWTSALHRGLDVCSPREQRRRDARSRSKPHFTQGNNSQYKWYKCKDGTALHPVYDARHHGEILSDAGRL